MSATVVGVEASRDFAKSGGVSTRDSSLRYHAVPFLVLVLAEILVGNQLALAGSPYPVGYLAAHIGLSVLLIALGAYLATWPRPKPAPDVHAASVATESYQKTSLATDDADERRSNKTGEGS